MISRWCGLLAVVVLFTPACGADEGASNNGVEDIEVEFAAFESQLLEHETAIASCMIEAGFDYIAQIPPDWVLEQATILDMERGGDGNIDITVPPDLNLEYLQGLSEGEQRAYDVAYWGDIDSGGTDQGCYFGTYTEVWGMNPLDTTDPVLLAAQESRERTENDARVLEALGVYIECMQEGGFRVADTNDLYRLVDEQEQAAEDTSAFEAFRDRAFARDDECRVPYDAVFNDVRAFWDSQLHGE